jgi:hypothetical protein
MTLLPLEDQAEFEKLHKDLITEYSPIGRHEEDLIEDLARLIWRKQNLFTFSLIERAKTEHSSIFAEAYAADPDTFSGLLMKNPNLPTHSPEEIRALYKTAKEKAQKELGPALEFVELGEVGTTDHLLTELEIRDRLDGMIDRVLKRLLMVRGLKSISLTPSQASGSLPRAKKVADEL